MGSTGNNGEREYLNSSDEVLFMQVFVDEVGVWMDSLDRDKHFSRIIPFVALKSPMMLNAFLACGVKHLTLVNEAYKDDKALFYYDTATTQLLRSLQNPDRDIVECATTAVVLNVYEIMSEKPNERMNHIAGARALIRECGWDARSKGDEEVWVHRIFYIVAKIANFRANAAPLHEPSPHDEQFRLQDRFEEWKQLKRLCAIWNRDCPRSMRPFSYLFPTQDPSSGSIFPNIW
ncbi:hypothetical protein SBRCBS47491_005788 [Sporothrix bragantina]|uniref:Uncharacterized protein n=1 Tax=Sporothrix bragantina TaxID=671064 RepID=A0ABP0C1G4_9PEZI